MQTVKVDLTNILGITNQEILMRARADLRLGIPIVLTDKGNEAVIAPIDVLSQARLDQLKSIDENSFILITARRAQTLKCPVYDGNFARIQIGNAPNIAFLKAISDPSLDLRNPLKGPFEIIREKPLRIENEVLLLLKSAQLLPAAIISRIKNGENFASKNKLTYLQVDQLAELALSSGEIADAITAVIPTAKAKNSKFHIGPGSPKYRFLRFFRNFYEEKSGIRESRVRRRFRESRVSSEPTETRKTQVNRGGPGAGAVTSPAYLEPWQRARSRSDERKTLYVA